MGANCLVVYDKNHPHHSDRLVNGLSVCGCTVSQHTDPNTRAEGTYDYIFVEHSTPANYTYLKDRHNKGIFLYDVEDKPYWFHPNEAYDSLKDHVTHYVKYNYQPSKPNPDGLVYIGAVQPDYVLKGIAIAKQIYPQRAKVHKTGDVYFVGGPTYMTDYSPRPNVSYLSEENIHSVVKREKGTGLPEETDWLYHQRLEWVYRLINNSEISFSGGLWFDPTPDPNHPLSISYQASLFGRDITLVATHQRPTNMYYTEWLAHPISLSPAGVARSSYRIIELMALGRIILLTDWTDYTYLYNPIEYIIVPDGEDISSYVLSAKENEVELLEAATRNVEIFATLTPEKMFEDFIGQSV